MPIKQAKPIQYNCSGSEQREARNKPGPQHQSASALEVETKGQTRIATHRILAGRGRTDFVSQQPSLPFRNRLPL